jgi:hypothetical protein
LIFIPERLASIYCSANMIKEWFTYLSIYSVRTKLMKYEHMTIHIFWNITLCSLLKASDVQEEYTTMKHVASRALPSGWLIVLLNLKKQAACSSEMSVKFYQTMGYYIPDSRTLYNYCYWNLTFDIPEQMFIGMRDSKVCNSKCYQYT